MSSGRTWFKGCIRVAFKGRIAPGSNAALGPDASNALDALGPWTLQPGEAGDGARLGQGSKGKMRLMH